VKINVLCPDCIPDGESQFFVELQPKNDCAYRLTCPKGHEFEADILYHEFEKLFEVAVNALNDNYFREAIGSFAASYERFLELFVRIVARSNNVDFKTLSATWKLVARQSERQIGAFALLYMLEFSMPPKLLAEDPHVKLRNRVIHQGYFPDRNECIAYGTAVLEFIREIIKSVHDSEKLQAELFRSINDQITSPPGPRMCYYAYPLIGTNRRPGSDTKTLEQMLEYCARLRTMQ